MPARSGFRWFPYERMAPIARSAGSMAFSFKTSDPSVSGLVDPAVGHGRCGGRVLLMDDDWPASDVF